MAEGQDDETLLAALREALRARQAVPPELIEAGQNAFAWHDVDAELAQLSYDSARDAAQAAAMRAEAASMRALTFNSAQLRIELEVTDDSLLGQLVPGQAGTVTVQTGDGQETALAADEIGCFSVHPIPAVPFRLLCRAGASINVRTGWITL